MAAKLIIPDIDIQEETGRGGFGVLYRGLRGDKVVAIKVQKESKMSSELQRSWNREAAALARLSHPALVRVLHVGKTENRAYLVMEFVEGTTLSALLRKGPLSEIRVLKIGIALAEALAEVHRNSLIHRDVKPSNIIVNENDEPKLIDFGLVAQVENMVEDAGTFVGSVEYCSPEQTTFLERQVDGRSDLYALGCVLFECLTGRLPFVAKDIGELLRQHAIEPAPTVNSVDPDVSGELSAIVDRLLSKDMDDRYQNGNDLARDLLALLKKTPGTTLALVAGIDPRTTQFSNVAETKLAGRESEDEALRLAWDKTLKGNGSVALVEGEPGSGKSRLVRSLLSDVRRTGAAVLQGKCIKGEVIPFSLLKSVIDEYIQKIDRDSSAVEAEAGRNKIRLAAEKDAAILKRFSPGLGRVLASTADIGGLDDKFDQYPAAVAEFFLALARQFPGMAFFVDDLQWIDPASREVLRRIATSLRGNPLLLVAAARDDEDSAGVVNKIVADFQKELSARFTLGPLNLMGIQQIVRQLLGGYAVSEDLITTIVARCNGNPFAISEYVRAMLDEGLLTFSWGSWIADTTGSSAIKLPNDVFELVMKRIGLLGEATRSILTIAAVLGTRINAAMLPQLSGIDRKKVLAALTEAVQASVMERLDTDIYEFAHDRIRESLLKELSPDADAAIHQTIAEALDALGLDDDAHVYALAHHFQRGVADRLPERRYQVTALAGKRALDACANQEAHDLLQSAVSLAAAANVNVGWETYEALGDVCRRVNLIESAVEYLEKALETAPSAADRGRIRILIGYCYLTSLDAEAGWLHVKRAFGDFGRKVPQPTILNTIIIALYGIFGFCCMITGFGYGRLKANPQVPRQFMKLIQLAGVVAYYRLDPISTFQASMRSLFVGWSLGYSKELALSYYGLGTVLSFAGLSRASRYYFEKAFSVANSLGDPMLLAECKLYEAYSINFGGRSIAAATAMGSVLTDYGRWLDANNFSSGSADLSENLLFRGYFRESSKWTEDVIAMVELQPHSASLRPGMMTYYAKRAAQLAVLGSVADAAKAIKKAGEIAAKHQMPMATGIYATVRILYHLELGELNCIDALIAERRAVVPGDPGPPLLLQRYFYIVVGYARFAQYQAASKDQQPEALKKFQDAVRDLKRCRGHGTFKPHYHVLAAGLHWVQGNDRSAFRELSKGDLAASSLDNPWAHYEAAKIRSAILMSRGSKESAIRHVKTAIGMAQDHGWDSRARNLAEEFAIERTRHAGASLTSRTGTMTSMRSVRVEKYLNVLVKTGLAASVLDPEQQSKLALDQIINALSAERGFLLLFSGNPTELEVVCARDDKQLDLADQVGFSTQVVNRVVDKKAAFVLTGTAQGVELGSASIFAKDLRSILAAPLLLGEELKGVIYLDSRLAKGIFTEADIGMISAIASQIALVLETARVAKIEIERRSMEKDLEVSGAVQSLLLPKLSQLQFSEFDLSSFCISASLSGGDWWWMHERPDKSLLLFLGDVTGHGVGAAMVAAAVAGSYRSLQALSTSGYSVMAEVLLRSMHESLTDFCRGEFLMTYIAVEVFPGGRLKCWFGGGPAPIILDADGVPKKIKGAGNPLGFDPFEAVAAESRLEPGQKLLLCTDGIPEMYGANAKMLRNNGFMSILKATSGMNAGATTEYVRSRLNDFRKERKLEDDATLITIARGNSRNT